MTARSVDHRSFTLERELAAHPARVFRAWSDPEAKKRWAACDDLTTNTYFSLDFRPYGSEISRVVGPGGNVHLFQGQYLDIVPDERIIYAYDIHVDDVRLSASLVTVLFAPTPAGTRMTFIEQIALLDGHQDLEERIHGTGVLFERIERELAL
ncbi:SRPBCC family protein [Flavisphingomonas formosensis]|uniref:SRPBCC family protein n=1 Tax=Flavisphingomonas formosensis TaxID=861534 RepID=UPI0012FADC72|nr:SRPBCC family protein [Sphingomonas formosensis]